MLGEKSLFDNPITCLACWYMCHGIATHELACISMKQRNLLQILLHLSSVSTQVYVVACAHAEQIQKHLIGAGWTKNRHCKVHTVVSTNCRSAGEALRLIDQKDVIKSNFILVSGDVVANLNIQPALQQHRTRRENDPNSIMTLVCIDPPIQAATALCMSHWQQWCSCW